MAFDGNYNLDALPVCVAVRNDIFAPRTRNATLFLTANLVNIHVEQRIVRRAHLRTIVVICFDDSSIVRSHIISETQRAVIITGVQTFTITLYLRHVMISLCQIKGLGDN